MFVSMEVSYIVDCVCLCTLSNKKKRYYFLRHLVLTKFATSSYNPVLKCWLLVLPENALSNL